MPCYEGDRFYDRCMTSKTHANLLGPCGREFRNGHSMNGDLANCKSVLVSSLIPLVMVLHLACTLFLPHLPPMPEAMKLFWSHTRFHTYVLKRQLLLNWVGYYVR